MEFLVREEDKLVKYIYGILVLPIYFMFVYTNKLLSLNLNIIGIIFR